jgi:DNA-directed RNA polymerase subunit beta
MTVKTLAKNQLKRVQKIGGDLPGTSLVGDRLSYSKIQAAQDLPSLVEIQTESFDWFMEKGIGELFEQVFPIINKTETVRLDFKAFKFDEPSVDEETAKDRDLTYSAPLKIQVDLQKKIEGMEQPQSIESWVFLGDFPLMTRNGTFVVNGAERALVSQLVRSSGIYFKKVIDKGREIATAKIITNRGAWIEFESIPMIEDATAAQKKTAGTITVRLDNKKIPVTTLLMALDFKIDPQKKTISHEPFEIMVPIEGTNLEGFTLNQEIRVPETNELVLKRGVKLTPDKIAKLRKSFPGKSFPITLKPKKLAMNDSLLRTYEMAGIETNEEAVEDLYRKMRPGDPPSRDTARQLVQSRFFDEKRYDLGRVGRYKLSRRLGLENQIPGSVMTLTKTDFIEALRKLIEEGHKLDDDIDHLGNRRVRAVGELIQNSFRKGLMRMERVAKERLQLNQDIHKLTAQSIINTRSLVAVLKEFFGSSQLSQFLDQTNPLTELTHKRRLSALGPGGLSRERAGFEVRDVHHSHYARICPIESPEGPNIGLIGSLASYSKVNQYGFLMAPYRKVKDGIVTNKVVFLDAEKEEDVIIAEANAEVDENGRFIDEMVNCRRGSEIMRWPREDVKYIDVAPMQVISPTTSLIPFLEHDDANRALMGSNMQRQAVPLVKPESPLVGTGLEERIARDSGSVVISEWDGVVTHCDGERIVIRSNKNNDERVVLLKKFRRSNQGTCYNQVPRVKPGQKVKKGQAIADGSSIQNGELALGRNVLVAFMVWRGYNFEDAIIISERLVKDDVFTSIHLEKFECEARDTKLGPEKITRDIPHLGFNYLQNLDERGIVTISTEVKAEDILVGKITPKGETDPTSEEKLLRAIFGEKSLDVRNTSLKMPHGARGKVVGVQVFSRAEGDELAPGVRELVRVIVAQRRPIQEGDKMAGRHGNKGVVSKIVPEEDMPFLEDGTPIDIILNPLGVPSRMNIGQILETHLGWAAMKLGVKFSTPVFDGANESHIKDALKLAGLPEDGKAVLRDGRNGEPFENKITVGQMFMLKLNHLVEEKVHARSVGSYALVTQQPLGGKAQFGGQRFGEMEVWALQAYGAAYTLQELLTVKSDDVEGRNRTYEAIVKGDVLDEPGIPESFHVLVRELRGLCLDIQLERETPDQRERVAEADTDVSIRSLAELIDAVEDREDDSDAEDSDAEDGDQDESGDQDSDSDEGKEKSSKGGFPDEEPEEEYDGKGSLRTGLKNISSDDEDEDA